MLIKGMLAPQCGREAVCPTGLSWAAAALNVVSVIVFFALSARRKGLKGGLFKHAETVQAIKETWYHAILDTSPILDCFSRSNPSSVHFRQEYALVRQQYGEVSITGVAVLHAFCTVLLFVQYFSGVQPYTRWWHAMWSGYGFMVVFFSRFPRLHNVKGVPVMYVSACTILTLFILPVDGFSKELVILSNAPIMMAFIMLAPLGGFAVSVLFQVVYSVVVTFSFFHASGDSVLSDRAYVFWQVSIGGGIMLMGSLCNILYMSNTIRINLERKKVLEEQKATTSLLSLVCDAVVEVDTEGAIVSDAKGLSSLLLHQGTRSCSRLQDVLYSDEDKVVFQELMEQSASTETITIRHLGMRDSMGSLIKTEVFHLSFKGRNAMRFLVGIKEHSDFERNHTPIAVPSMSQELEGSQLQPTSSQMSRSWEVSESGSSAPSVLSRAEERFMEGTMPTSRRAMDVCVAMVMSTWIPPTRIGAHGHGKLGLCCSYHAAVIELRQVLRRLRKRRCDRDFTLQEPQCPECGVVGYTGAEVPGQCPICDGIEKLYPTLAEPVRQRRRVRQPRTSPPEDAPIFVEL